MTPQDWQDIYEWVQDRWPRNGWEPEQAAAYYRDLKLHDPADVWQAIYRLYGKGLDFPPGGSKLLAAVTEIAREAARLERRSLPVRASEGTVSWKEYAIGVYGRPVSLPEAARIEYERSL